VIKLLSVSLVARSDSVLSCQRVRREYVHVSSLRSSGRSSDKTWLASFSNLWKSLSSASSTISELLVWSATQKPLCTPRLTEPVIRLRSVEVEKPHQTGAACSNLLITTEWQTVCTADWFIPWASRIHKAYSIGAQSLMMLEMWSLTESLLVSVTLSQFRRRLTGSLGIL